MWDASATTIEVPLENTINMCSVWTAWFQFWGKQHLLHIDALSFHNIVNVQHRIKWVQLDRLKKALKYNGTSSSHFVCQAAWRAPKIRMQRKNRMWIFILNSMNIQNSNEFLTALAQTHPKGALMKLLIMTWDPVGIQVGHFLYFDTLGCVCFQIGGVWNGSQLLVKLSLNKRSQVH